VSHALDLPDIGMYYYNCFSLRVTSGETTSAVLRLEKGIITGCTISVILFALAMNMQVKSAEVECRGPLTNSGTRQPPIRAYMHDLTVTTTSVPGCRWILQGLERLITWTRMDFKPVKSRSLVLRRGKVTDKFRFSLGGVRIPSVSEKSVKSLVAVVGIEVRTGRKWRAQEAVDQAEARLRHSVLVGTVAAGRAGLGNKPRPHYNQVQGKERHHLVQDDVQAGVEEARTSKMVWMRKQAAWMRWEQALDRKITWSELWKAQPHQIKFMVQSVYDVLPSPSNLFCWCLAETPACPLCQRRGSLEHILSCRPKALGEGRYRWRHDQVLRVIADVISTGISFSRQQQPAKHAITFVGRR
ncbi:hypothetical protein NFI96_026152, partial [Prochilodus magdalenae]